MARPSRRLRRRAARAMVLFAFAAAAALLLLALLGPPGLFVRLRTLTTRALRRLQTRELRHDAPATPFVPPTVTMPAAPTPPSPLPADIVYDGGLRNGWSDYGWSPREVGGGPAKIDFAENGGWIVAKPGYDGRAGALVFRMKTPPGAGDFVEVHVESPTQSGFPRVVVTRDRCRRISVDRVDSPAGHAEAEDWDLAVVPIDVLDPDGVPFDRIVFRASRGVPHGWTMVDGIALTRAAPSLFAARLDPAFYDAASTTRVELGVDCGMPATAISPFIYGIAYDFMAEDHDEQWRMGATIRRWGGNPTTRYNWEIGAWNLDSDWFYENVRVPPYTQFLDGNAAHGVAGALTVPILGWVAKDTTSVGFPVAALPGQDRVDPNRPEAGDGLRAGKELPALPPTQTSVAVTPDFVERWVEAIRRRDGDSGPPSVAEYILDNEPSIWHHTHRDVRTSGVGYDELVLRTIQYAAAIRRADPHAVIAGPAEYGWLGYFYSGKDSDDGWSMADNAAHGGVPFIEWYLRKLREHEEATGTRVLDLVDLHYYPAEDGVHGPASFDPESNALRIRSTRSLWDPTYEDESWVHDTIELLPRMKRWIARNYPGRGISIGEWSFGGEGHPSGGLATAEALGRYAQAGVTSAFYWTFPPADSPTMLAFLAYRDFDGHGGRFLDYFVPSHGPRDVSLFASRDADGRHLVLVAINPSPDRAVLASIDLSSCGAPDSASAFAYVRGAHALVAAPASATRAGGASVNQLLAPYSITVVDLRFASTGMSGPVMP